jgi:hypothetical protein
MPLILNLPNGEAVEFPDGTKREDIAAVLGREYPKQGVQYYPILSRGLVVEFPLSASASDMKEVVDEHYDWTEQDVQFDMAHDPQYAAQYGLPGKMTVSDYGLFRKAMGDRKSAAKEAFEAESPNAAWALRQLDTFNKYNPTAQVPRALGIDPLKYGPDYAWEQAKEAGGMLLSDQKKGWDEVWGLVDKVKEGKLTPEAAQAKIAGGVGMAFVVGTADLADMFARIFLENEDAPDTYELYLEEEGRQDDPKSRATYDKLLANDAKDFKDQMQRQAVLEKLIEKSGAPGVTAQFRWFLDPTLFGGGVLAKPIVAGTTAATKGLGTGLKVTGRASTRAGVWAGETTEAVSARLAAGVEGVTGMQPATARTATTVAGGAVGVGGFAIAPTTTAVLVGSPRVLRVGGKVLEEAGIGLERGIGREGLFGGAAGRIEQAGMAGSAEHRLARALSLADTPLEYGGHIAAGAAAGGVIGGGLGYLAEGDEGLWHGLGAGMMMGGFGGFVGKGISRISGAELEAARSGDIDNYLKRLGDHDRVLLEEYRTRVGDEELASILDMESLVRGGLGDGAIKFLNDRAMTDRGFVLEVSETGGVPTMQINLAYLDSAYTIGHEFFHLMGKVEQLQPMVQEIMRDISGIWDGERLVQEGMLPRAELEARYQEYIEKLVPSRAAAHVNQRIAAGEITAAERPAALLAAMDTARAAYAADHNTAGKKARYVAEEIAAEHLAMLIKSSGPDAMLKAFDTNTRRALDYGVLKANSGVLGSIMGRLSELGVRPYDSVLFPGLKKANPVLHAMLRDLIRARKNLGERMEATDKMRHSAIRKQDVKHHVAELDRLGMIKQNDRGKWVLKDDKEIAAMEHASEDSFKAILERGDAEGMSIVRTVKDDGTVVEEVQGRRFSPGQVAEINGSTSILPTLKTAIVEFNKAVDSGTILNTNYYAATRKVKSRLTGKYTSKYSSGIKKSNRDMLPYSLEISKAGNIHVKTVDWSKVTDAALSLGGRKKLGLWDGSPQTFLNEFAMYLSNLSSLTPERSAARFGVDKAEFFHNFLQTEERGGTKYIRNFRLDRMDGITPTGERAVSMSEQAFQLSKQRFMPGEGEYNPGLGLEVLKGTAPEGLPARPTVLQAAQWFQDRAGKPLDWKKVTPEQVEAFDNAAVAEVKNAMELHPEAAGWYDENLGLATSILREVDPSLTQPRNDFVLKVMTALTSDGNEVSGQFNQAWNTYSHWRDTGKYTGKFASGDRVGNIRKNIKRSEALVKKLGGEENARDWLRQKGTISEVRLSAQRDLGMDKKTAMKIGSGELVDAVVPYAVVFGPKLGSFFNNLFGDYSTVTMDRWFMRTIGRLTGTQVKKISATQTASARRRLRAAFGGLKPSEKKALNATKSDAKGSGADDAAKKLSVHFSKTENRKDISSALNELRLAANSLAKLGKPLVEAPASGKHRKWIRERIDNIQKKLKDEGIEIENADLQALLWYNEKELYNALGVRSRSGAADYASAAEAIHERVRGRPSRAFAEGTGRVGRVGRSEGDVRVGQQSAEPTPSKLTSSRFMPGDQDALGMFSAAERAAVDLKQNKGTGHQMLQMLRRAGVKEEEIRTLGLDEFLEGNRKVTKDEIIDHLVENQVTVEETVLGERQYMNKEEYRDHLERLPEEQVVELAYEEFGIDKDALRENIDDTISELAERHDTDLYSRGIDQETSLTKHASYVEPGAVEGSYRELLLRLPEGKRETVSLDVINKRAIEIARSENIDLLASDDPAVHNLYHDMARAEKVPPSPDYTGGHYGEYPNTLAHIRFNERTGPKGEKVLFVEELQSDWHQEGRKKGYGRMDAAEKRSLESQAEAGSRQLEEYILRHESDFANHKWLMERDPVYREMYDKVSAVSSRLSKDRFAVPDAPFKTSWHELAMKRMIKYAADNGYDSIAWTKGETQAARYDLSKQVESLQYEKTDDGAFKVRIYKKGNRRGNPDATHYIESAQKLEEYVGKDIAEKMVKGEGRASGVLSHGGRSYFLGGLDLKVGGEGMKGFYDKMLPRMKTWKKLGLKVEEGELKVGPQGRLKWTVFDPEGRAYDGFETADMAKVAAEDAGPGYTWRMETAGLPAHIVPLTPDVKAKVLDTGLSRFMPDSGAPNTSRNRLGYSLLLSKSGKWRVYAPKGELVGIGATRAKAEKIFGTHYKRGLRKRERTGKPAK